MTNQAVLRVILGPDNSQRVVISAGLPSSVAALEAEIQTQCKIMTPFRLQFMDPLFGNDFVNLTSIEEIQDKATLKVVYTVIQPQDQDEDSFSFPSTSAPDVASSSSGDSTVILSSPESTSSRSSWPDLFLVPRFTYDAEIKLEKAHVAFKENGMLLIPDPKLKSDILEGLIQEVVKHTVYPTDRKFDQVAEALILRHPCLKEKGSPSGYAGWKMSLKYKLSNYRTHLRKVGCPEVCVNALKHKPAEKCSPAYDVKRPKRGEVDYCPPFPLGESEQSLETIRIELLSDVKKRNNRDAIKDKMNKTFSLRRQEVIYDAPMISELQERWPALFDPAEINAEFKRITTMPLQSRFLSQLDFLSESLLRVFSKRSGKQGKMLKDMTDRMMDDVDARRESLIKGLCLYLNENPDILVHEYMDMTDVSTLSAIEKTTAGVYVAKETPGKDFPDVGIIIEGVVILQDLDNVALATAMLFGLFTAST
ncbi:sterile alpha motif domain-containing protein 3 isoform X1 [Oryzias latipes]|uniref:sterile alpha motif domain-containing protein 3 isoform X1 n=2 Tax=Oryzias latipes TaxID=8090 RepID=UPI000CE213FC|nr:sterile alpha motif domain-containing protein 3 isoform X1 [Oryzias latipes]